MNDSRFEFVDAAEADLEPMFRIASAASARTFNTIRSTTAERARYLESEFRELVGYWRKGLYRFIVARELETQRVVGYLWLNLHHLDDLGRRQTYLEDLGALPEISGSGIGDGLIERAAAITAELGLDFMGAEIGIENPVIEASYRRKFQLEAYKIVRPCTPDGETLLARVKEEKAAEAKLQDQLRRRQAAREERRRNR